MSSTPYAALDFENQRHIEVASKRQRPKLIIVDGDGRVVLDSIDNTEYEYRTLLGEDRQRLRRDVDVVVRVLIAECLRLKERNSRVALLDSHRFVRVTRLDGPAESFFAVSVEYGRGSDSLSRAARKYQLTQRELEVLAMILDGSSALETARELQLAETTVQGYYKRLLVKTQSRNRPAMVANVLDWSGSGRRRSDGRNGNDAVD